MAVPLAQEEIGLGFEAELRGKRLVQLDVDFDLGGGWCQLDLYNMGS